MCKILIRPESEKTHSDHIILQEQHQHERQIVHINIQNYIPGEFPKFDLQELLDTRHQGAIRNSPNNRVFPLPVLEYYHCRYAPNSVVRRDILVLVGVELKALEFSFIRL